MPVTELLRKTRLLQVCKETKTKKKKKKCDTELIEGRVIVKKKKVRFFSCGSSLAGRAVPASRASVHRLCVVKHQELKVLRWPGQLRRTQTLHLYFLHFSTS